MAQYIIYQYTSPSGKSYIGQTNNIKKRHSAHKSPSSKCVAFKSAIQKYGINNFEFSILEQGLTADEANVIEERYILECNTLSPYGYNLKTGGDHHILVDEVRKKIGLSHRNKHVSMETREKIKRSMTGEKNHFYGKKHSAETKEKFSHRKISQEVKTRISNTLKGKYCGELHPFYGKKHSVEAIDSMREKLIGMYDGKRHPNAKRYMIVFPTGETFDIINLNKFCIEHSLHQGHMASVANGKLAHYKKIKCYKIKEDMENG